MCLVFIELYSGGLMTFRCLSILTASGRRVRSLSFCPHTLLSWTRASLGRGVKEYGVFTMGNAFREPTVTSDLEHCDQWMAQTGNVSGNDTIDFFYTNYYYYYFYFCSVNVCSMHWCPLGYDSDLQRICIIKLVEKFMIITSVGVFYMA